VVEAEGEEGDHCLPRHLPLHCQIEVRFPCHTPGKEVVNADYIISQKARLTGRGTCGLVPVIGAFVAGRFPKFLAGVVETVARPKAGAEEVNAARTGATVGGLKVAARLRSSSSSTCLLASACLSLQVSFLAPPAVD